MKKTIKIISVIAIILFLPISCLSICGPYPSDWIPIPSQSSWIDTENGAIAKLHEIWKAEQSFTQDRCLDQDNDEIGEYGLFSELIGKGQVRNPRNVLNGWKEVESGRDVRNMYVALGIPNTMGVSQTGYKYNYILYLPCGKNSFVSDAVTSIPALIAMSTRPKSDINLNESHYIVYAWPTMNSRRFAGRRMFVMCEDGEVFFLKKSPLNGPYQIPSQAFARGEQKTEIEDLWSEGRIDKGMWKKVEGRGKPGR